MAERTRLVITLLAVCTVVGGFTYMHTNHQTSQVVVEQAKYADTSVSPLLRADGFIRNCINKKVIGKAQEYTYNQKFDLKPRQDFAAETSNTRLEAFKKIFHNRGWGSQKNDHYEGPVASGQGSTLHFAQEMIGILHSVIDLIKLEHKLDRVSLLDIPCGDMAWMSRFLETRSDVDYTGIDIVSDLVEGHRKRFANQPWQFINSDVAQDGINRTARGYDLVLSRHMLQHLSFSAVFSILGHVSNLGRISNRSVHFLTTSFSQYATNHELDAQSQGRFRTLNLEIPPLSLTAPLCLARDGPKKQASGVMHYIGLWKLPLRQVPDCEVKQYMAEEFSEKLFRCEVRPSA